jgi:hypothetical protein
MWHYVHNVWILWNSSLDMAGWAGYSNSIGGINMDANELIKVWKVRREEIYKKLPPELYLELKELNAAIRKANETIKRLGAAKQTTSNGPIPNQPRLVMPVNRLAPTQTIPVNRSTPRQELTEEKRARIPLSQRKIALIQYLKNNKGATRAKILNDTGIPNGSLGMLLQNEDFINSNGHWMVKEG